MTREEFLDLVAAGEGPGVEFKNPRGAADHNFWEVAKAVLGMANRRDGGLVLVGVADNRSIEGLSETQVASWENVDAVRQKLGPFADPFAYVDIQVVDAAADGAPGRRCAAIAVQPFDQVPLLCGRAFSSHGREVLRQGACYVRSRQMPATTEIADHAAFRVISILFSEHQFFRAFSAASASNAYHFSRQPSAPRTSLKRP